MSCRTATAPAEPVVYTLSARAAIPFGRVKYDTEHHLLSTWKTDGGARWDLAGLPAGTYALTLHYYAGPFAGGKLRVATGASTKGVEIKSDDSWKELRFAPIGDLTIAGQSPSLSLSIEEARGLGVLELVRVELEPVPEPE